jgi:GMP synthase-like glutamine amidotransferase
LIQIGYSAYEDIPWIHALNDYVKRIYQEFPSKKIIGICFGHQIVAQALGGKVELNQKGWELAVRRVIMAESAKGIFDLKNTTMVSQNVGSVGS